MKPHLLPLLLAVALLPAAIGIAKPALAQVDLSQILPQIIPGSVNSTFTATQTRNTQTSNIVISVRDFSSNDDFCGNSGNVSFLRSSSLGDGFDFPHAGRQSDGFPHAGKTITAFPGGATTYFQLPAGARNPDIIGCVDAQRNTVFLTIRSQRQTTATQPQSQPEPSLPPINPPTQTTPSNPIAPSPQTQILLPRQTPVPAGVSP